MLGFNLQVEHVEKYAHGQEWFGIVRRIRSEREPFDHQRELEDIHPSIVITC